jgi:hypothetical protein
VKRPNGQSVERQQMLRDMLTERANLLSFVGGVRASVPTLFGRRETALDDPSVERGLETDRASNQD